MIGVGTGLLAAAAALLAGWLLWGRPAGALRRELAAVLEEVGRQRIARGEHAVEVRMLQSRLAELADVETGRAALAARVAALDAEQAERGRAHAAEVARTNEHFAALAAKALETAQTQFLERAEARLTEHQTLSEGGMKALLAPVAETLQRYEGELKLIEASRQEAYGGLKEQLVTLAAGQQQVSAEAARLIGALRSSGKTSGSWGEQQLRNTLEMAGLREGIDFTVQAHAAGEDGGKRPDAVINMPGGRQLIVDSKCSLHDYLSAAEADGEDGRRAAYKRHAAAVRVPCPGAGRQELLEGFRPGRRLRGDVPAGRKLPVGGDGARPAAAWLGLRPARPPDRSDQLAGPSPRRSRWSGGRRSWRRRPRRSAGSGRTCTPRWR